MECLDSETFKGKIFDYETQRVWKYAGALPSIVDFHVDVFKVNVDQAPEVAQAFGVGGIEEAIASVLGVRPP